MTWHLALEHQMDLHKDHLKPHGQQLLSGLTLWNEFGERENYLDSVTYIVEELIEGLWRGDTLFVTRDMHQVIFAAAEAYDGPLYLPDTSVLTPRGWCLLEEPLIGEDLRGAVCIVHAMLWVTDRRHPNLMHLFLFTDSNDPRDEPSETVRIEYEKHKEEFGQGLPAPPRFQLMHYLPVYNDPEHPELSFYEEHFQQPGTFMTGACLKYWIALNLLAQQTIGTVEKTIPPRSTRKRSKRWDPEMGDRYISLIQLRKKKGKHNEEPKNVDWSHRWVVGGHWRKQWYAKEGVHRYVYIYEYVKGPEDKPLIIRERRVFNFAR